MFFTTLQSYSDSGIYNKKRLSAGSRFSLKQRLQTDVQILKINFKDDFQKPRYDAPKLLQPIDFEFKGKRILLVDDRIKSGSTIKLAKELLAEAAVVKTFAVNGEADYALFNESCFRFPWNV